MADRDQTPLYVASDLGLHCLDMSHKNDARIMWVNIVFGTLGFYCWNKTRRYVRVLLYNDLRGQICWLVS